MKAKIRKIIVQVDEIHQDGGKAVLPPTRRALAMAVIDNPYAGRFSENLDELIDIGEELGGLLGERCVQALGITPAQAHSYGKAAIVGEGGEPRCSAGAVGEKTRHTRHCGGCAFGPQRRRVCAQPFRCHGSAGGRCAACKRNRGGRGGHRQRQTASACGRITSTRDRRQRRPAVNRC